MPGNTDEKEAKAILVESGKAGKDDKNKKNKDDKNKPDELSEEDQALKEGLELAVTRLKEADESLHKQALDHLANEIRTATSSMTSVPKPLKFLRPHYDALKAVYDSWPLLHPLKKSMADMMSVLAMTMAPAGSRESLQYRLKGTKVNLSSWGHEYLRSLSGEISEEFNFRLDNSESELEMASDDLLVLVDDIVPFQMKHNAEAEAVDLLMEVKQLNKLVVSDVIDDRNFERVCLYLLRSTSFVNDPEDLEILLETAYSIYKTQRQYTSALRVALKMNNDEYITELFSEELGASTQVKQQMALMLGRSRSHVTLAEDDTLNELIGNTALSERFLNAARELDVLTPKSPEDIYKTHLVDSGAASRANRLNANGNVPVDSARANLAATFTNAFVNAGYCKDKLIIDEENGWLFKNKGHGMMSAAASLGMLMMWNVDEGLNQIDKYFHNSEDFVKAGACLGVGIVSSGVRNEADPALALLSDYIENPSTNVRTASICGLGIAYAGAQREEVKDLLECIVGNTETNIVEVSMAALSLGLTYVGTCNDDVGSVILQRLMETSDVDMNNTVTRFMCLGLGLIYLGKGEAADAVQEALKTIEHKRSKYAEITLETCAYAGSGNVLKVQNMLRRCTEHLTEDAEHQAVSVLGIALITAGEEIGIEMCLRTFEHLTHYGELPIKRVIPLAVALLYVSNPEYAIIDQLSRLSHDQDAEISQCAIFGLGLISAGSNNSRIAGLLRSLAEFYAKEANHLFIVRIAQGLNAMGKGLLGLSPFHSDRVLMNGPGLAGLLTVLHACIDIKGTILDKFHYILFFLAPSMNPRFLSTVDADLNPVNISVRVGLAVETVGQAGRPKTITGFQTHTTPVLLGFKDRAELAGSEYTAVSPLLEGVVIVEKTPVPAVPATGAGSSSTAASTTGSTGSSPMQL